MIFGELIKEKIENFNELESDLNETLETTKQSLEELKNEKDSLLNSKEKVQIFLSTSLCSELIRNLCAIRTILCHVHGTAYQGSAK